MFKLIQLDNLNNTDYIFLRSEDITEEEYDEIIDLIKQVLRRNKEDRIIQELDFTSWMTLR